MKRFWMIAALCLVMLLYGFFVGKYQIFPYQQGKFVYSSILSLLSPGGSGTEQLHWSMLKYDAVPTNLLITRTSILNTLIDRYAYRSYLEIGQGKRIANLDFIDCPIKIGVDPDRRLNAAYQMTSDEFFEINDDSYDLIFIDGLHHSEQVERDIVNSLNVLNENGTIVVHDCNPANEEMQVVPPVSKIRMWTGDVWKAWAKLRATRPDLSMYVVDCDYGCGVIRRGKQEIISLPDHPTYGFLEKNRREILNLIDVKAFLDVMKSPKQDEKGESARART